MADREGALTESKAKEAILRSLGFKRLYAFYDGTCLGFSAQDYSSQVASLSFAGLFLENPLALRLPVSIASLRFVIPHGWPDVQVRIEVRARQ